MKLAVFMRKKFNEETLMRLPTMNLQNFEKHIDSTIVDRGYTYYMDGHVMAVGLHDDESGKISL